MTHPLEAWLIKHQIYVLRIFYATIYLKVLSFLTDSPSYHTTFTENILHTEQ